MSRVKICGIYQIKNTASGKVYVGKSVDVSTRFIDHRSRLKTDRHFNPHLQNSYNKYGEECFKYSLIEKCDVDDLPLREQFWIDHYESNAFNTDRRVTDQAGENNSFFGKTHTEEVRQKMSLSKIGKYKGKDNPNYGNKYDLETRKSMTFKNSSTKLTEQDVLEIKELLLEGDLDDSTIANRYNIARTVITRIANGTRWTNITGGPVIRGERRGKRNIGKPRSKETREKISRAITGIKRSKESRDKMSQAQKKRRRQT